MSYSKTVITDVAMDGLALVEKYVSLAKETSGDDRVCGHRQVTVLNLMVLTSEMARSVHALV